MTRKNVAALAAAGVVVIGHLLQLPITPVAIVAFALCFGLRLLAIRYKWQLPTAKYSEHPTREVPEKAAPPACPRPGYGIGPTPIWRETVETGSSGD